MSKDANEMAPVTEGNWLRGAATAASLRLVHRGGGGGGLGKVGYKNENVVVTQRADAAVENRQKRMQDEGESGVQGEKLERVRCVLLPRRISRAK